MTADIAEKVYISASRKRYGELHKGGKNINIADGGQGGNLGFETNKKISESLKGREYSEETRRKISESSRRFIQENPEHLNKMVEARKNTEYVAWNKGKNDIFTNEQLGKISEGAKDMVKKQKQALEDVGLIAITDKAKKLGISRAMVLKRFNCFDYYVGNQKFKVCRIDEEPHFEDGRGKVMTEKRREACLKNLGIVE